MMKLKNRKGFTLAELLIVVAIIGVLVAISLPVFTSQLEKSRDATSVANLRSAYAEASAAYLIGDDSANADVTINAKDEGGTVVVSNVKIESTDADFGTVDHELPFKVTAVSKGKYKATFVFAANGGVTCTLDTQE